MNKFMGFYELKALNLPTVQWREYKEETMLDGGLLWTVRVAVEQGHDLNLPRLVGAPAEKASQRARELLQEYRNRGMVVYYPYFIAEKSGVLEVSLERLVIEAVEQDLWNFVTNGQKDVTVIKEGKEWTIEGKAGFLSQEELEELERCAAMIRGHYREEMAEGLSILAEWSYAYATDVEHHPVGSRYLVFFELRTL